MTARDTYNATCKTAATTKLNTIATAETTRQCAINTAGVDVG
jgi:hypothetical protein